MNSSQSGQPSLKLEKALGLTSLSNASFCSSPSGDLFYAAGCFVVKYNPDENKQKGFYKGSKAVSCVAISGDGRYLAVGERGQVPVVTIWNVDRFEVLATLSGHKHGVGCMTFSPDGRYLVTVGFKLDRQLILWDWKSNQKLSTQKLGNRVHAVQYHQSGEYFLTAGDRHLKWWTVTEVLEGEAVSLEGKAASILEDMRNSVFMDVVCGSGKTESNVYSTTSTGVLCMFNGEKMVEKWVQLESASSFCLELFAADGAAGLLIVGCANGIIRCFDPLTLQYVATLPLPAPLLGALPRAGHAHHESAAHDGSLPTHAMYAACYGVRKVPSGTRSVTAPRLATIYADRSLFVWDISDLYAISKYRSFQYHRACVWDIQFIEHADSETQTSLPKGTFVTCCADNTLRFWNTDQRMQRQSKYRSIYSREMLHCIDLLADVHPSAHFDDEHNTSIATNASRAEPLLNASISMTHYFAQQSNSTVDLDVCEGVPDLELPDRPQSKYAPRALAVHPGAHELACGDKMGTLMIFDIRGMRQISATPAHAAEILTLSYSPVMVKDPEQGTWVLKELAGAAAGKQEETVLLASAGRDRLIHAFDASNHYAPLQTLDHHSSSVTIVKFTSDGRRFLSCGGDRNMVFSSVDGPTITRMKSVQTPHGTINGLAVEASNKFAVTSGQDKRLNIWNLTTGKHMRAYRNEHIHSELYKSDIDPSGTFVATCAFDKTISVFDFFSGELVTQVSGHSELVTGVKFSPDGRYLVSIGGDGCIFMWRVADSLVKTMQDRLLELMTSAQRRNMKASAAVHKSHADMAPGAHLDAPPPLPAPSFGLPTAPAVAPAAPPLPGSAHPVAAPATGAPKSRWAERVQQDHGYELFGKKIDPTATPDRKKNKFTLELTSTTRANLPIGSPAPVNAGGIPASSPEAATDETAASVLELDASRQGEGLEAGDDVRCGALSEDDTEEEEGDGSEMFKPLSGPGDDTEYEYASDFETPTGESAAQRSSSAPDLDRTHDVIEGLEKSAQHLENWLEDMIRSEGKLDEAITPVTPITPDEAVPADHEVKKVHHRRVVNKTTGEVSSRPAGSAASNASAPDMLDKSLSSAFFQNLRRNGDGAISDQPTSAGLPPPPPHKTPNAPAAPPSRKEKQRETAAAVAQMKERLRVMGMLAQTKSVADDASSYVSSNQSPAATQATSLASRSPAAKAAGVAEDGYETASTASEDEGADHLDRSTLIANEIAQKASKYRNILRELEVAKRKAAESFQELNDLRQSLDQSMRESTVLRNKNPHHRAPSTASIPEHDVLDVSMAEVTELVMQFQDSLQGLGSTAAGSTTGFVSGSRKSTAAPTSTASVLGFSRSTDSAQVDMDPAAASIDVNAFLERYSEKLADLVGEKLLSRMSVTK